MEPIRVLQCFTILNRGGAETMIMNYYRNIDREKVQFDFLVHRDEVGAYEEEIKKLGGRIYRLPAIHPLNYFKYRKEASKFLLGHPEYKIIHGHFSELGCWLYRQASKRAVPNIIVHAHNYPTTLDLKSIFRWYWKHRMRRYVTHYFSCSQVAANWLFGKRPKREVIEMWNAIDLDKFAYNQELALELKSRLGLSESFVIGHVGRFNVQKNHSFLIDIFNEIKKQKENSVLVLVGVGELEGTIKEKVAMLGLDKSVLFLGSRDDVCELMHTFDLFLFPSLFEGLPVVMVEAQANGLSCVTSTSVTNQIDLTGNVNFISLEESAEEWATKILNGGLSRQYNISCLREGGYDVKKSAKWLERYYQSLIENDFGDNKRKKY